MKELQDIFEDKNLKDRFIDDSVEITSALVKQSQELAEKYSLSECATLAILASALQNAAFQAYDPDEIADMFADNDAVLVGEQKMVDKTIRTILAADDDDDDAE